MEWFATVNEGLEDIAAKEIQNLLEVKPELGKGRVFFKFKDFTPMYLLNFFSRTINKLYLLLERNKVNTIEEIYKIVKSIDYREFIGFNQSFAIRAERIGKHEFSSMDIGKIVGKAVIDSYMEHTGSKLKVDLENPDVEILALLRFDEILIGINTTGEGLHKRRYRVYNHPAALKTTIASSMLMLVEYNGETLLDPMCGGGTIPIEAAHIARNYPISMFRENYAFKKLIFYNKIDEERILSIIEKRINHNIYEIYSMDISEKHIKGAIKNAESAKVIDTIKFIIGDALNKNSYSKINPKIIATNPPYGIRSWNIKKIEELYKKFLKNLVDLYSGVKLIVITSSSEQFMRAAQSVEAKILHKRIVKHGNLIASIFLIML
ncbi:MAG: tRNA (guanine(6)-N2)-methyltransferase [Candidatus Methanomethylicaceae archaeon]